MKRIILFGLALTSVMILSVVVLATNAELPAICEPAVSAPALQPGYDSVTGTVKDILPSDRSADAVQKVVIEDENGAEYILLLSKDTLWATEEIALEIGDKVIAFYDRTAPMTMIYPPQYNIEIMVVNLHELTNVTVDRFDDKLISSDGALKIKIGEHIQVVTPEGKQFFDENGFANRMLVVFHDIAADGKALAWRIIVLYEKAVHPIWNFETPVPPIGEIS